ncbi:MAG: type II toxin-antitoxin system VapC family toxin [Janthinobacterium lividum]
MNHFVLDSSILLSWCFEDAATPESDWLLSLLTQEEQSYKALVPALWHLEVANFLLKAEKSEHLTPAESLRFLDLLECLPLETDITRFASKDILTLMRTYDLTACEAVYFLLAMKTPAPLATFNEKLKKAATKARISLVSYKKYKPFAKLKG